MAELSRRRAAARVRAVTQGGVVALEVLRLADAQALLHSDTAYAAACVQNVRDAVAAARRDGANCLLCLDPVGVDEIGAIVLATGRVGPAVLVDVVCDDCTAHLGEDRLAIFTLAGALYLRHPAVHDIAARIARPVLH